jgi:perosamine synthetase
MSTSHVDETNPTAAVAAVASARVKLTYPSKSLSATSSLPITIVRARALLNAQLGRAEANADGTAASTAARPSKFKLGDPKTFYQVPYAALYIDCSWRDLLYAYQASLLATETAAARSALQLQIAEMFRRRKNVYPTAEALEAAAAGDAAPTASAPSAGYSPINVNATLPQSFVAPKYLLGEHNILVTLSARTCLDLYLTSRKFPAGSYVLLSAINIPDISVVLRSHQLVPLPIDIDPTTLQPDLALLDQTAGRTIKGHRVCAFLIAHLYGRRFSLDGIARIAQKHQVDLIEDMAESFSGFEYIGHPSSDLTFVSFGSIKVATSFGGGLGRIRKKETWDEMRKMQDTWVVQTRSAYFTKCCKNTLTMLALNVPSCSSAVMRSARAMNFDHKALVVSMLRGFPDRLMERLRAQPSGAMLSMLHRRLSHFSPGDFQQHQDVCDLMVELLPHSPGCIPGAEAPIRNHWLFPVTVEHIDEVLRELNAAGVDAYKGATQLALVPTPEEAKGEVATPAHAADLMQRVIYLPVHKHVTFPAVIRMALIMHQVMEKVEQKHGDPAAAAKAGQPGEQLVQPISKL